MKALCDAIFCADTHIRSNIPSCRKDDFIKHQFNKVAFILKQCKQNQCPLLVAGDFGDKSQWPNKLLEEFISITKIYDVEILIIPGQHDLPEHRLDYWKKSGIGVLHSCHVIKVIQKPYNVGHNYTIHPFSYGIDIDYFQGETNCINIAMTHQMVLENKPLWRDQKAPKGHELLKKFPEYDIILSGDNHLPFMIEYEGRKLINPGSMMRTTIGQINHKPRVYKWWTDTNDVEPVYLPITDDIISQSYIKEQKERNEKMTVCISKMADKFEFQLSFKKNMTEYLSAIRTKKSVIDKVWKATEEEDA